MGSYHCETVLLSTELTYFANHVLKFLFPLPLMLSKPVQLSSNIIEEGRRTRRKAAPLSINPEPKDQLPSDLSGPDLSEGDDGDDSDEYAALSDESN